MKKLLCLTCPVVFPDEGCEIEFLNFTTHLKLGAMKEEDAILS
jgi:hypothetical protein